MTSTGDLIEAFHGLGFTLKDPEIINRLCYFCDQYGIDQNQVSTEYLDFAKKRNYQEPNFEILEQFDLEVLNGLQSGSSTFDEPTRKSFRAKRKKYSEFESESESEKKLRECFGSETGSEYSPTREDQKLDSDSDEDMEKNKEKQNQSEIETPKLVQNPFFKNPFFKNKQPNILNYDDLEVNEQGHGSEELDVSNGILARISLTKKANFLSSIV